MQRPGPLWYLNLLTRSIKLVIKLNKATIYPSSDTNPDPWPDTKLTKEAEVEAAAAA
jgi:hypothetical protein